MTDRSGMNDEIARLLNFSGADRSNINALLDEYLNDGNNSDSSAESDDDDVNANDSSSSSSDGQENTGETENYTDFDSAMKKLMTGKLI